MSIHSENSDSDSRDESEDLNEYEEEDDDDVEEEGDPYEEEEEEDDYDDEEEGDSYEEEEDDYDDEEEGDPYEEEEGSRLFRLCYDAWLENCGDMVPEWNYKSLDTASMQIQWECGYCSNDLGVHQLHFLIDDTPHVRRSHLSGMCRSCMHDYWAVMDDSYCKPCTVSNVPHPYYGVLMGFWVSGTVPIRYLNPPTFAVPVVVNGVSHLLGNLVPGTNDVTYNFMGLLIERRPVVSFFSLDFYDEESWAALMAEELDANEEQQAVGDVGEEEEEEEDEDENENEDEDENEDGIDGGE